MVARVVDRRGRRKRVVELRGSRRGVRGDRNDHDARDVGALRRGCGVEREGDVHRATGATGPAPMRVRGEWRPGRPVCRRSRARRVVVVDVGRFRVVCLGRVH